MNYPLPVLLEVHLADPNGEVPRQEFFQLSRDNLVLMPGRPETVNLALSIPEAAESVLIDGLYEGQLSVLHAGTGLPITIVTFEHVENTGDEPCETIRFSLDRPQPDVALRWALRDWIRSDTTGTVHALIRVSFYEPFTRTVLLEITNTSRIERTITVISNGAVFDEHGQRVPGLRLIPLCESLTEEFAAGETKEFLFGLEVDHEVIARCMQLDLAIDGPGLVRRHLPVRIHREDLLEPRAAICLNVVNWGLRLLGVIYFFKWWRSRMFRNGRSGSIHRLKALFRIVTRGTGCHLESSRHRLLAVLPGSTFPQPVQPGQKLAFSPDAVSYETPLRVKVDGTEFRIDEVDSDPEDSLVHARFQIDGGGPRDQLRRRSKRCLVLALVLTGALTALASLLHDPSVVSAAQWLIDAITG